MSFSGIKNLSVTCCCMKDNDRCIDTDRHIANVCLKREETAVLSHYTCWGEDRQSRSDDLMLRMPTTVDLLDDKGPIPSPIGCEIMTGRRNNENTIFAYFLREERSHFSGRSLG